MAKSKTSRGTHNQQVARAGEHFVVAELNKRGVFAVNFAGNMPRIDLIACNRDQSRMVLIQVKSKSGGQRSWQTRIVTKRPKKIPEEIIYWVFIDLGVEDSSPRYWIVSDWWIRNDIYNAHERYKAKHGGQRARNPDSLHHAIEEKRLRKWQSKWEILGIFEK